jgi:toxin ParE1/3/4
MPYFISQKALEDLDSIWQYTFFQWSEKQADKYYNLLIDKILYLSSNLEAGRKIDHIKTGYRSYGVESHIIFYTVAVNGIITIIRILHQKMDLPNRLNE